MGSREEISEDWSRWEKSVESVKVQDFPGTPVVKTPSFHCRGHGFDPWSGKIPHAVEQLSPCATTTEPASHNY